MLRRSGLIRNKKSRRRRKRRKISLIGSERELSPRSGNTGYFFLVVVLGFFLALGSVKLVSTFISMVAIISFADCAH